MKQPSIYRWLSQLPGLKRNYTLKVLVVAFLCIHIPLMLLLFWLVGESPLLPGERLKLVVFIGVASMGAALLALSILRDLIKPVLMVSQALQNYLHKGQLPVLPTEFQDEVGLLMTNTQQALVQFDQLRCALEESARTDNLTGLYNRRAGEQLLQTDLAKAERNQTPFFLAVLDINRFKELNDSFGHEFGDACLQHVAKIISRWIRKGDWLARWGGDEFVLLVWRADAQGAEAVYRRIIDTLTEQPLALDENGYCVSAHATSAEVAATIRVSVSIGACEYGLGMTSETLFRQADAELYKAKAWGGGVSIASPRAQGEVSPLQAS